MDFEERPEPLLKIAGIDTCPLSVAFLLLPGIQNKEPARYFEPVRQ
jgi:hypothetical protein